MFGMMLGIMYFNMLGKMLDNSMSNIPTGSIRIEKLLYTKHRWIKNDRGIDVMYYEIVEEYYNFFLYSVI